MYHALHMSSKKSCRITCLASKRLLWEFEQRVLQTGSSEGALQWQREGQQLRSTWYMLHPIHMRCVTCHKSVDRSWCMRPWIYSGTRVCKAQFQGAALPCSRWPIASFMLPGFIKLKWTLFIYTQYTHVFWVCGLDPFRYQQASCFCLRLSTTMVA